MSKLQTLDGSAHEKIATINRVIIGIVVVTVGLVLTLTFSLGGIINDVVAEKKASYLQLADKVDANNDVAEEGAKEIEKLNTEIQALKEDLEGTKLQNTTQCRRLGISC